MPKGLLATIVTIGPDPVLVCFYRTRVLGLQFEEGNVFHSDAAISP